MPNALSLNLAYFSFLKIQLYIGIRQKYKIHLGFNYTLHNVVWKNLPIKIAFLFFLECLRELTYLMSFINIILMTSVYLIYTDLWYKKSHDNLLFSLLDVKYQLQSALLYFSYQL